MRRLSGLTLVVVVAILVSAAWAAAAGTATATYVYTVPGSTVPGLSTGLVVDPAARSPLRLPGRSARTAAASAPGLTETTAGTRPEFCTEDSRLRALRRGAYWLAWEAALGFRSAAAQNL